MPGIMPPGIGIIPPCMPGIIPPCMPGIMPGPPYIPGPQDSPWWKGRSPRCQSRSSSPPELWPITKPSKKMTATITSDPATMPIHAATWVTRLDRFCAP